MPQKNLKQLTENLYSTDIAVVLETLKQIREQGDVEILKPVMDLYNANPTDEIRNAILQMLSDLKKNSAVPILMELIHKQTEKAKLKELLIVCWMSNLNYQKYLADFIDIFIDSDFNEAFEAFTVIENMLPPYDKLEIKHQISKLTTYSTLVSQDKRKLLNSLLDILKSR